MWLILGCVGSTRAQIPLNYAGWYGCQGDHPFTEGTPWVRVTIVLDAPFPFG